MKTVCISGGFDPVHIGHIDLINSAAGYGKVIVILNSDEWLIRKKGYNLMSFEDRKKILLNFHNVWEVISVDDSDGTVCEALKRITPFYFANGGDRKEDNTPEKELCKELGIEMLWGIGGGKIRGSQEIVNAART